MIYYVFFMKIVTTNTNFLLKHFCHHVQSFMLYIFSNSKNIVLYIFYNTFMCARKILIQQFLCSKKAVTVILQDFIYL